MVRVVVKGGVWKNTEDEILKAAISKYGKNQWARISSLLVRKTPKQCKARWYEWLDPSIKKTEWSREEDEKLLHLAKLMPTQWRTIAPIVGRTATQCLERYQHLLDEAEQRDNEDSVATSSKLGLSGPEGGESAPSAEDVRRLRPGEIDPDPETKPARPDAIDMDEDEKEMLSEARARLANTQGKKAKRKARERALEEARRLAMLQKRRELKAAGISTKLKGPKNGMDYMTDIPFEKQPALGFYDTSEEQSRAIHAPIGKSIGQLDNPNRARKEDEERKRKEREQERKKQSEKSKESFSSAKEEQLRKLKEQEQVAKRRKLDLPEALVGQSELDDIVKMGLSTESARGLVSNEGPTGVLLDESDKSSSVKIGQSQTPHRDSQDDTILRNARDLRRMQMTQTPLLANADDGMEGEEEARRKHREAHTGDRSSIRVGYPGDTDATPSALSHTNYRDRSLRTPLRDNLGLNSDDTSSVFSSQFAQTSRAAHSAKARLQRSLMGLPAPKNDFDIVLDEAPAGPDVVSDANIIEDAAERERRAAQAVAEEEMRSFARQSQAVRRGLPRPANVDEVALMPSFERRSQSGNYIDEAHRLILEEMVHLAKFDSVVHPIAGSKAAGGQRYPLRALSDKSIALARDIMDHFSDKPSPDGDVASDVISAEHFAAFEQALQNRRAAVVGDGQKSSSSGSEQLQSLRSAITTQSSEAAKDEKRLGKLLGGYQARSKSLAESIVSSFEELQQAAIDQAVFDRLHQSESLAIAERMNGLQRNVEALVQSEREAQSLFREQDETRRRLQAAIASKSG